MKVHDVSYICAHQQGARIYRFDEVVVCTIASRPPIWRTLNFKDFQESSYVDFLLCWYDNDNNTDKR